MTLMTPLHLTMSLTTTRLGRSDLNCVWACLPCFLLKGTVKQRFLDIYLTMFFRLCNFGNTLAMTVIFILNMFKILSRFPNSRKKLKKNFVSEIIAPELVALDCLY